MKKIISLTLSVALATLLMSCNNTTNQEVEALASQVEELQQQVDELTGNVSRPDGEDLTEKEISKAAEEFIALVHENALALNEYGQLWYLIFYNSEYEILSEDTDFYAVNYFVDADDTLNSHKEKINEDDLPRWNSSSVALYDFEEDNADLIRILHLNHSLLEQQYSQLPSAVFSLVEEQYLCYLSAYDLLFSDNPYGLEWFKDCKLACDMYARLYID